MNRLARWRSSSVSCAIFRAHRSCPVRLPNRYDVTKTYICACRCHSERRTA